MTPLHGYFQPRRFGHCIKVHTLQSNKNRGLFITSVSGLLNLLMNNTRVAFYCTSIELLTSSLFLSTDDSLRLVCSGDKLHFYYSLTDRLNLKVFHDVVLLRILTINQMYFMEQLHFLVFPQTFISIKGISYD